MIQAAQFQVFKTVEKTSTERKKPNGEKAAEFSDVLNQKLCGTANEADCLHEGEIVADGGLVGLDRKEAMDETEQENGQALLNQSAIPTLMFICVQTPELMPVAGVENTTPSAAECTEVHQICTGNTEMGDALQVKAEGASDIPRPAAADITAQTVHPVEPRENLAVQAMFREIMRTAGSDPGKAEISIKPDAADSVRMFETERPPVVNITVDDIEPRAAAVEDAEALFSVAVPTDKKITVSEKNWQEHPNTAHMEAEPVHAIKFGFALSEKSGEIAISEKETKEHLRPDELTLSARPQIAEVRTGVSTETVTKTEEKAFSESGPVFAQVAQKAVQTAREHGTGGYVFDMKLFPEGLGKVEVRMVCKGESLSLTVTAHHGEAGRLLSDQTEQLRAALSEHYQVTELNVRTDVKAAISDTMAFLSGGFSMARHDNGGRSPGELHPYAPVQETEPEFGTVPEIHAGILNAKV